MGNDLLDFALLETSPPRGKRLILAVSGSYLIINQQAFLDPETSYFVASIHSCSPRTSGAAIFRQNPALFD
jgi:hypothetical protein